MRKLLLLSLLSSLLLLTGCEFFSEEPSKGNINYVVVGLDYENSSVSNLSGPLNDAREMSSVLDSLIAKTERTGGKTFLMLQEGSSLTPSDPLYPTVDNVTTKLNDIASTASDDDLTIFYYSGHGEVDSGKLILATKDGSINETDRMAPLTLLHLMNGISGKKLLLVDNCYSGQYVEESNSSLSMVYSDYDYYAKYFSDESYALSDMYVLSASAKNTESYEAYFTEAGHSHGYFTYALLKGLGWVHTDTAGVYSATASDGIPPSASRSAITVDSLYAYILENQMIKSGKLYYPHQHPMTNGGAMDMVLFNF